MPNSVRRIFLTRSSLTLNIPRRTLAILKPNQIAVFYFEMVCEHSVSVSQGLTKKFRLVWSWSFRRIGEPYQPGDQIQPENQLGLEDPSPGKTISDTGQSNT